jgi:hypothetical protein
MFEHVGRSHYDELFRHLRGLLAEDGPDGIDNTFAGYVVAGRKEDYRRGAF